MQSDCAHPVYIEYGVTLRIQHMCTYIFGTYVETR